MFKDLAFLTVIPDVDSTSTLELSLKHSFMIATLSSSEKVYFLALLLATRITILSNIFKAFPTTSK